jgi:predicted nucleotidyltransferase
MTLEQLRKFRPEINAIARRRGIGNVRVFGSVARGDAGPESDIDFLVEVEPGRSILAVGGFLDEVSELIGKPVQVVTAAGLGGTQSRRAISEAVPL